MSRAPSPAFGAGPTLSSSRPTVEATTRAPRSGVSHPPRSLLASAGVGKGPPSWLLLLPSVRLLLGARPLPLISEATIARAGRQWVVNIPGTHSESRPPNQSLITEQTQSMSLFRTADPVALGD